MQSISLAVYLLLSSLLFASSLFTEKIKLLSSLHKVKNTNYLSHHIVRMSFYDIIEKDSTGKIGYYRYIGTNKIIYLHHYDIA